ncbi:MAG: LLM class flavin-dependent oxidoreductase, partial [Candidatus Hodarchaeota archaeon]
MRTQKSFYIHFMNIENVEVNGVKFSFSGPKATVSARHIQDAVNLVEFAETIGYDRVWFSDGSTRDTYVIMTLCGLHTRRIELGVGVTNPYMVHPLKTAESIATVDEVTCGRAI